MTTPPKTTYTAEATINGEKITANRTSHRFYTHAAMRGPYGDGRCGVTFHGSAAQAARRNEYGPVALVVEVTSDRNYNAPARAKASSTAPEAAPSIETQEVETAPPAPVEPVRVAGLTDSDGRPIAHVSGAGTIHTSYCPTVSRSHVARGTGDISTRTMPLDDARALLGQPGYKLCANCGKAEPMSQNGSGTAPAVPVEPAPTVVEPVPVEAAPVCKTSKASTKAVLRALTKQTGRDAYAEVWHSLSSSSVEEFRADADRYLNNYSELRSKTIESADWVEVYAALYGDQAPAVEETDAVVFASDVELGGSVVQVLLALAELAEQGRTVRIESGPLAGVEEALLAAAPALAQLHRNQVSGRVSAGLAAARTEGRKGGRPKVDADRLADLAARLGRGEPIAEAAKAAGVSRASAYRAFPKQ